MLAIIMLTIEQVAARLGVTRMCVYKWVKEGSLPAFRLARRAIRVEEAALEKWLAERATKEGGNQ